MNTKPGGMDNHFILCGLGRVGRRVLESLTAAGLPVVVIDTETKSVDESTALLIQGDCRKRELLEQAGVARAQGVLILTSDQSINISTLLMVRSLNPQVRIVVRLFNQNLVSRLGAAVQNVHALSVSGLTAPLLALTALTGQTLGAFHLENGQKTEPHQIVELTIGEDSPLCGGVIAEVASAHRAAVVAHFTEGQERLLRDVRTSARLQAGDRLAVCGQAEDLDPLLGRAAGELLPAVRWANWLRRTVRMVRHTIADIDLPVRIAALVLLLVIVASTFAFYYGVTNYDLVDAFYRAITVIVTGSDEGDADLQTPAMRVFVSILRLAGVALIAAFTAIFTNYLLRARLGAALEVRRIPDGGHIIVCGLGNIGFRVVEELIRRDEQVVAIERTRDSRFLATARRLGAAVIIGDATVPEVLRQAHAGAARAIVAATSDELTNLEIGLLVRDIDAGKRVVLRINEPQLAQSLRDAARIRLALAIPSLAAPAFVAPLFGDRVRCVFLVGGRPLAVVDILVEPQDAHLLGLQLNAFAEAYRFLVIAVRSFGQSPQRPRPDQVLQSGDQLTLITALPDLQKMLQAGSVASKKQIESNTAHGTADAKVRASENVPSPVIGKPEGGLKP